MKKMVLGFLLFALSNSIFSQSIEVIVTDTIMCKVEKYEFLLSVNFYSNSRLKKMKEFEDELRFNKYVYEKIGEYHLRNEDNNDYVNVKYTISFENEKSRSDFEMKFKLKKYYFVMEIMEYEIEYKEEEKLRLLEKLIDKGKEKAGLIAKSLNMQLGEVEYIKELKETIQNRDENIVIVRYIDDRSVFDNSGLVKKIKSLQIAFKTH